MGKFSVLERKFFSLKRFAGGSGAKAQKSEFSIRIFHKKSSNFVQKVPQFFKIKVFGVGSLGASRLGWKISQHFPSVFEIKIQSLLGQSEVRLSKAQSPATAGQTNLFLSPFGRL